MKEESPKESVVRWRRSRSEESGCPTLQQEGGGALHGGCIEDEALETRERGIVDGDGRNKGEGSRADVEEPELGEVQRGPVLQLAEGVIAHRECANGRTADANRLQLVEKEVLQFNRSRIHQLQVQSLQRTAVG